MAIITGQLTVDNTIATALCTVPAGVCNVMLSNIGPGTVVIGPGPGNVTGNGHFICPGAAPTYWASPSSSKGGPIVAASLVNGQTATVSFMICT